MDPQSFESIPRRAFLDTNVVNLILDYGDYIHEDISLPSDLHPRVRAEVESLAGIFDTGQRAFWQFAISPLTYAEINATRGSPRRAALQSWFAELWYCWCEAARDVTEFSWFPVPEDERDCILSSGILDVLPDIADRVLIADAIAYRCDCFCTFDRRTVLKHRDSLHQLPIKILSPSEWWAQIQPWAPIWC